MPKQGETFRQPGLGNALRCEVVIRTAAHQCEFGGREALQHCRRCVDQHGVTFLGGEARHCQQQFIMLAQSQGAALVGSGDTGRAGKYAVADDDLWSAALIAVGIVDGLRYGDAPVDAQQHGAVGCLLHRAGEQIGQVLGPNHGQAGGLAMADKVMALPADARVNMEQRFIGSRKPAPNGRRLAQIKRLDAQTGGGGTLQQGQPRRMVGRSKRHVIVRGEGLPQGQHMFANARGLLAVGGQDKALSQADTAASCRRCGHVLIRR